MDLPECHNAAIEKAAAAMCESESPCPSCRAAARDAITAYLAALKERGLMRETILYPVENIHWVTNTSWVGLDGRDGDTRALIIRMEQK